MLMDLILAEDAELHAETRINSTRSFSAATVN